MSPENYKVIINRREEKEFEQLHFTKEAPLEERLLVTTSHFGADLDRVVDVLDEARKTILVYQKEGSYKGCWRWHNMRFFEKRLEEMGISGSHSNNLIIGMIDHMALKEGKRRSEKWWRARSHMIDILSHKVKKD